MQYIAPHSLEDAVQLLLDRPDAKVLAGGTDLLVRMRSDMADPETILDIKRIDAMRTITQEDGGWRIGAAVSGAEMGENAGLVADAAALLRDLDIRVRVRAALRVQNQGIAHNVAPCVLGSLLHADQASVAAASAIFRDRF